MAGQSLSIDREHTVLLLTDIQPDFMPGGALAVPGGDQIVEPTVRLLSGGGFRHCAATQDWHPPGHISFASSHPGHAPMDRIELYGHQQVLWPDHCVQNTDGAQLHPAIPWERVDVIVRKATDPAVDSYSAFRNNWGPNGDRPRTGLAGYLRDRGMEEIVVIGLARDYCVKWSVEDAVEDGFRVSVIWDLTRSIDAGDDDALRADWARRGVRILQLEQLGL
ncbi:MAG: bifunctional nicotinamidase/pyrazinamidase [Gammaproteobacteria bacterium]